MGLFAAWLATAPSATAQDALGGSSNAEGWAWSQLEHGLIADFGERCGTARLDPAADDPKWADACRAVSAASIADMLTKSPWREALPFQGLRVSGARIVGDIKLANAKITVPIEIVGSRLEGMLDLSRARTDSVISLFGTRVTRDVVAEGLHAGADLLLAGGTTVMGDVDLTEADVARLVNLREAKVLGTLKANLLRTDGDLYLNSEGGRGATFANGITLRSATVRGSLTLYGASVGGTLDADSLKVGESLLMGQDGPVAASFQSVILRHAAISGLLDMRGSKHAGKTLAGLLRVDGDAYLTQADFAQPVTMALSHLGGALDLRGSEFSGLDLSGATVAGDLRLGSPNDEARWDVDGKDPCDTRRRGSLPSSAFNLRNAHVGNLMDTEAAWPRPCQLYLAGFGFDRLGGFLGQTETDMRRRGEWWDTGWARLDPDYSSAPYAALAAALFGAGDKDAAAQVRYLGRVRERETQGWGDWILSGFLQYVGGFGIGTYTFRVLYWVIGISVAGAVYLKTRSKGVQEASHSLAWCLGASFARLLPVIEVNKEFTDFFDDPRRERLTGWQSFVFSAIGIVGFVLGAILVAAVSGLIQGS